MRLRLPALLVLALLLAALAAPAAEAASCQKTSLLDIQDEVMCVICGVPLVNAGGDQSEKQRQFIRDRAERCETKQQIKDALVAEYGPAVLAMPQKKGFDLTAYLVPLIAGLLALTAITLGALRWRRDSEQAEQGEAAAESETLLSDMQKYDL